VSQRIQGKPTTRDISYGRLLKNGKKTTHVGKSEQ